MSNITRYKYPRTPHMPFSPGSIDDDKVLSNLDHFIGREVVVTEKLDGENCTLYSDYYSHARSIDSKHHPSRNWVKSFHSGIVYKMPTGLRICGENMYAQHSIAYDNLDSYFYAFSVWKDNLCLSWEQTKQICTELDVCIVPILWRGIFNLKKIQLLTSELDFNITEGLVMRVVDEFTYDEFGTSIAKYVRADHVTTDEHWMSKPITPNKLKR